MQAINRLFDRLCFMSQLIIVLTKETLHPSPPAPYTAPDPHVLKHVF